MMRNKLPSNGFRARLTGVLICCTKKTAPRVKRAEPGFLKAKPLDGGGREGSALPAGGILRSNYLAASSRHRATALMMRLEVRVAPATVSTVASLLATIAAVTLSMAGAAMP